MTTDNRAVPRPTRLAGEDFLELEMLRAAKKVTGSLFHYTSAEAAISGILATGTLRLSPFESTNDLWESRPSHPGLSSHFDDVAGFDGPDVDGIWDEIDRNIRLRTKVVCLTQDIELPDHVLARDSLRGWAHLSLWAHYGAAHTGVCLQFDRDKLVQAFLAGTEADALRFHGPVKYLSTDGGNVRPIDRGQVKEFGIDAVALAHAEANKDTIFFRKHHDWSNEAEYRLVLLNQSVLPSHVDIRGALTGVILGDAFSPNRTAALEEILQQYPDVPVHQLRYHNRHLILFPHNATTPAAAPVPPANRPGSLTERLTALRNAHEVADRLRAKAEETYAGFTDTLADSVKDLAAELDAWPKTEVAAYMRIEAVPPAMRHRAPGVPGERIHLERGWMAVVENLPKQSHTFTASAAFQVLDDDALRLHAAVSTERWDPQGNDRADVWRTERLVPAQDADTALDELLADLREAANGARAAFDRNRGQACPVDVTDAD
ncbi:DUF2971 domain-containing protein [Streptomyces sp. TLI_171]|uniref:DUF2971 domain-containing protein n=1 Tax=Streptomyces sp. TLI_171 TaxID=1938859 RepID=UPI000C5AF58C|nr:DUF2971 domain-containing protein [Streptomyces sp. TLI_171]RKE02874.1 hypothetical protein BX266_7476 [Streptomyces sp. TLI_171]